MNRIFAFFLLVPGLLFGQVTGTVWATFAILNMGSDTLIQNPARALEIDANDTLWAGLASGLAKGLTDSTFYHYVTTDSSILQDAQNDVRDVAADTGGNLWVATGAGLLKLTGGLWSSTKLFNADSGLSASSTNRVVTDSSNLAFVGITGTGLNSTDGSTFTNLTDSIPGTTVYALAMDSLFNIWVGTDSGASVYMGAWFSYDTSDGLPDNRVTAIAVDSADNVWFGTPRGVVMFDKDTTWTDTYSDSIDAHVGRNVLSIACFSNPPMVWFGTDGGIVSYKASQAFPYSPYYGYTASSTNDSLPDNLISDIIIAADSTIWIATPDGIVRLTETRE